MTLGHINTSTTTHLVNEHKIMYCLGFEVDHVVEKAEPQRLCRLCFGQALKLSYPR